MVLIRFIDIYLVKCLTKLSNKNKTECYICLWTFNSKCTNCVPQYINFLFHSREVSLLSVSYFKFENLNVSVLMGPLWWYSLVTVLYLVSSYKSQNLRFILRSWSRSRSRTRSRSRRRSQSRSSSVTRSRLISRSPLWQVSRSQSTSHSESRSRSPTPTKVSFGRQKSPEEFTTGRGQPPAGVMTRSRSRQQLNLN